jgi:hypothetical protein
MAPTAPSATEPSLFKADAGLASSVKLEETVAYPQSSPFSVHGEVAALTRITTSEGEGEPAVTVFTGPVEAAPTSVSVAAAVAPGFGRVEDSSCLVAAERDLAFDGAGDLGSGAEEAAADISLQQATAFDFAAPILDVMDDANAPPEIPPFELSSEPSHGSLDLRPPEDRENRDMVSLPAVQDPQGFPAVALSEAGGEGNLPTAPRDQLPPIATYTTGGAGKGSPLPARNAVVGFFFF